MKQTIKQVMKPIKELDAEIRTIEHQDFTEEKEKDYYFVSVGLMESLGEQGDILTLDYEAEPTEAEIIADTKEHLKETLKELKESGCLTSREEEHLKALNKLNL